MIEERRAHPWRRRLNNLRGIHVAIFTGLLGSLDQLVPALQGFVSPWVYLILVIVAAVLPGLTKR